MSHICYQVVNKGYGSVLVWLAPGSYFVFVASAGTNVREERII